MRRIAELIPPEKGGHYSDDPAIREAAKGTEICPWADKMEGEVKGTVHWQPGPVFRLLKPKGM